MWPVTHTQTSWAQSPGPLSGAEEAEHLECEVWNTMVRRCDGTEAPPPTRPCDVLTPGSFLSSEQTTHRSPYQCNRNKLRRAETSDSESTPTPHTTTGLRQQLLIITSYAEDMYFYGNWTFEPEMDKDTLYTSYFQTSLTPVKTEASSGQAKTRCFWSLLLLYISRTVLLVRHFNVYFKWHLRTLFRTREYHQK